MKAPWQTVYAAQGIDLLQLEGEYPHSRFVWG